MAKAATRTQKGPEDPEVMMGLLSAVGAGETVTQRSLSAELGIALGLVNAYLKHCINKGLIKVQAAPARRYAYYLTPQGFAEKSRLTVLYLSRSFDFFRRARESCTAALESATRRGWRRVVLVGAGELAEVATLCALESPAALVAIYDPGFDRERFAGLDVVRDVSMLAGPVDGAVLTAMSDVEIWFDRAKATFGADRVIVPDLLGFVASDHSGESLKQ